MTTSMTNGLHAFYAVRLRNRRVVRRVRLAILLEYRAVGCSEVRLLESRDRAEGVVVHDHPYRRDAFLERRGQQRRVLAEAAVAHQRDHHAIGPRELRPKRRRRAEAHRGVAAGREDRARLEDRELLPDAVLIPAHVGRDQCIAGYASLSACLRLPSMNAARTAAIWLASAGRRTPSGTSSRATRFKTANAGFKSATAPISTG